MKKLGGEQCEARIAADGPLLGVDPGAKRVGVALAGALGIVHPLTVLDAQPRETLLRRIAALAGEWQCVGIVVGLPYNMDGSEGPAARSARSFGAELAGVSGLSVAFCDERLTSFEAEEKLRGRGLTRKQKKRRLDALAAAAMLESFLTERRQAASQGASGGEAHQADADEDARKDDARQEP